MDEKQPNMERNNSAAANGDADLEEEASFNIHH